MRHSLLAALAVVAAAGCAEKKTITIPVRHAPRVAVPGAVRTLLFENVAESRGALPGGFRADKDDNAPLLKSMLSTEFSGSSYAVLNDDLMDLARTSGILPRYIAGGPTMAADFVQQMVGDPGSVGVVEIDLTTAFGDAFTAESRQIALRHTTWSAGQPRVNATTENITVHTVRVHGSVSATVRIRSPYPDGQIVFEKTYAVPAFDYASGEAAPSDLFFFGRRDSAKQGNAAPTLVEVKAILFKKLARMFYEDINPSTTEEAIPLDKRGDRMAYNLVAAGAFPWAERRLKNIETKGTPAEQSANLYNWGVCWEGQGFGAEAATKYKAALALDAGNSLAGRALQRVGGGK